MINLSASQVKRMAKRYNMTLCVKVVGPTEAYMIAKNPRAKVPKGREVLVSRAVRPAYARTLLRFDD
jgi:hypothetical protein